MSYYNDGDAMMHAVGQVIITILVALMIGLGFVLGYWCKALIG